MGRQVLAIDYGEAGQPHPDYPHMKRITQFECHVGGMRLDPATGELLLQIRVPVAYKSEAWSLSDLPNYRLLFDVYKGLTRKQKRELMRELGIGEDDEIDADADDDEDDDDG